jgi:hypothetical protein
MPLGQVLYEPGSTLSHVLAVTAREPLGLRHLHSTYEIENQSNDENGSENAAADIHEVLRWLTGTPIRPQT